MAWMWQTDKTNMTIQVQAIEALKVFLERWPDSTPEKCFTNPNTDGLPLSVEVNGISIIIQGDRMVPIGSFYFTFTGENEQSSVDLATISQQEQLSQRVELARPVLTQQQIAKATEAKQQEYTPEITERIELARQKIDRPGWIDKIYAICTQPFTIDEVIEVTGANSARVQQRVRDAVAALLQQNLLERNDSGHYQSKMESINEGH